jgi:putative ABC transport system substrate-binding protein
MRRREFVGGIAGAVACPLATLSQQSDAKQARIIAFSGMTNDGMGRGYFKAFKESLEALGWRDGRNARIEYQWATGESSHFRTVAAEMVRSSPDVVLTMTVPPLLALLQETRTIPLIFVNISDPVDGGIVESLGRPGGNITGFTSFDYSVGGKWVELLKEAVPSVKRVLVLHYPGNYTSRALLRTIESVARSAAVHVISAPVRDVLEIVSTIEAFAQEPNGGIIILPDPVTTVNDQRITALAASHHLPTVHQSRFFAGGDTLMTYGADFPELYRRAGTYADRVLKGANVGELPIQNPSKYELVVNLKTARILGLTIPPSLLARADEVIE